MISQDSRCHKCAPLSLSSLSILFILCLQQLHTSSVPSPRLPLQLSTISSSIPSQSSLEFPMEGGFQYNAVSNQGKTVVPNDVNFPARWGIGSCGPAMHELPKILSPLRMSTTVLAITPLIRKSVEQRSLLPSQNEEQMASIDQGPRDDRNMFDLDVIKGELVRNPKEVPNRKTSSFLIQWLPK